MQMLWIEPRRAPASVKLAELWTNRELLHFLALRELKIRYKQTAVGVLWVILQPLLSTVVLSLMIGYLTNPASYGAPYPLFVMAGLVPWGFFSNALTNAAMCMILNPEMVAKIYFPRAAMPIAMILANLVDFTVSFAMLVIVFLISGWRPGLSVLALPAFVLLALVAILGVGLGLCALSVVYRDVRYAIPFVLQLWMFASPVFYPARAWSGNLRLLAAVNPMMGVIEGFRWCLFGGDARFDMIGVSAAAAVLSLVLGARYFLNQEPDFADII